jgi:hypothetical protein
MTLSTKNLTSIFTLLVITAFTAQVNADEYHHIDQLARKIQRQTKQLKNEVRHYRHTPEYDHLVHDTNEIYRLASHIHDVTHFEGNLVHLEADLRDLDREFHHLERAFDRVEHNAAYGYGRVSGNTKHVKRLLESIEDSIHHISLDVQTLRTPVVVSRPVYTRPVYTRPVYTSPVYRPVYTEPSCNRSANRPPSRGHGSRGHGHQDRYGSRGGSGFAIGGGSSKIHFRF